MKSIIIGAGTYGEVYLVYLQEIGIDIMGFLDDDVNLHEKEVRGVPVLGGTELLRTLSKTHNVEAVYCPIGNNILRVKFLSEAKKLGYKTPNFIHSSVQISPNVTIGDGVYMLPGTIVMPYSEIKDYTMISMGVKLAHHSVLEEGVFLSTGVSFGASIVAKRYSYVGMNSTIMTGIKELAENCLIGAGAVVIKNVPKNAVVVGNPARILKIKNSLV